MPVYRSDVQFAPVSHTNGTPEVLFVVTDGTRRWSMRLVRDNGSGNAYVQLFSNSALDGIGSFISGVSTITGVGTGAYDSGGTLAFEKDEALDELRWVTPLGTQIRSLSGFGALNSDELEPASIVTGITRSPTTSDSQVTVGWSNFYGKADGVGFMGCAMSRFDPGLWQDPQATSVSGGSGGAMELDNSQQSANYRSRLFYTHAIHNPRNTTTREYRIWRGSYNLGKNPWDVLVDAVCHPYSGDIIWVRVPKHDQNTVLFGVSSNGGVTLNEATLTTNPGSQFAYPALDVGPDGRIYVWWSDKADPTNLWVARSSRYGRAWETISTLAMPGGLTRGTVQGFRFHPVSGVGVLVLHDPEDVDLKLAQMHAWSGAPVWVRDPFPSGGERMEGYGTVWFDARGYTFHWGTGDTGSGFLSSANFGASVEVAAYNTSLTSEVQYRYAYARGLGLLFYLHQNETNGDLKVAPNDDHNGVPVDTTLYGAPAWVESVAVAGAIQQYAALVVGPGSHLYLLYQTLSSGAYSIACKKSRDSAVSWS